MSAAGALGIKNILVLTGDHTTVGDTSQAKEFMIKFVPGIKVPEEVEQRLRKAKQRSKEAFLEENIEVFGELIREIRRTTDAAGVHMMAVGFEWVVPKIIERSGVS